MANRPLAILLLALLTAISACSDKNEPEPGAPAAEAPPATPAEPVEHTAPARAPVKPLREPTRSCTLPAARLASGTSVPRTRDHVS